MKKKVIIISPCILPVPAVKGGAVLTLIESIIARNEKHSKVDLTIVGSYDEQAKEEASKYTKTNFIFLKQNKIIQIMDRITDYFISKIKKSDKRFQYIWKLCIILKIKKLLFFGNFDKVVFQNSGFLLNVLKDKKISKKYEGRLYYHLHNDIPDNIYINGVKQCNLILISNYLLKKINNVCNCDMSNQSFIVQNGINTDKFSKTLTNEEKNNLKKELNIKNDKKIIMYAGRIVAEKGIEQLTDAFINLDRDDCVLLIVGSHNFGTNQSSEFEKKLRVKFESLRNRIIFTGYIKYENIWKYYSLSDVAVLPSIWEEPAGLTMIEAAVAGVPVITTNSGGIPEYLNDEHVVFIQRDENIVDSIQYAIEDVFYHEDDWKIRTKLASNYIKENYSEDCFYTRFIECINKSSI